MGYSADYVIPRFVKYAGKPDGYEPDGKLLGKRHAGRRREHALRQRFPDGSGCSLYYGHDREHRVVEIRSYGSHFPLGRLVLTASGKRRRWILNGDWWSGGGFGRTNDHNEMMREAAQRSGTPWYIIPFSAAREAGIALDTITPVAVDAERWTPEEHTAVSLDRVPDHCQKRHVFRDQDGRELARPVSPDGRGDSVYPDGEGGWSVGVYSALDGHSRQAVTGPAYESLTDDWEEITPGPDGLYRWTEDRHWLGESVIRARVSYYDHDRRRYVSGERWFLSAFDEQEPAPLWFLAQLPAGSHPDSVAAARQALKPPRVRVAELMGREILRQGDVFAIRTDFATREIRVPSQRSAYVLGVNHVATEVREEDGVTYARGFLYHRPRDGRARDHVTLQLGDRKTWFELVRNTVPSRRAWALAGNVD